MRALPCGSGRYTRRGLLTALGALAVSGCAIEREAKTTALHFAFQADDLINPNSENGASPVVMRIYELKDLEAFNAASLFELLDGDTTVLGQNLVAKREIEVKPGEKEKFERSTPIETHYIGVIAAFRTVESAQWRTSVEITPEQATNIMIKLTAQTVSIAKKDDKKFGFF